MCSIILFCFILLSMLKVKFLDKVVEIDNTKFIDITQLNSIIKYRFRLNSKSFILITRNSKLVSNNLLKNSYESDSDLEIDVIIPLKGGFIIDSLLNMLWGIINMFIKLGPIIVTFAKLFVNIFEIIPLIFDPPTFINDILFGITWGINNLFSKIIASMNTEKEKDPNSESGTFGVSEENQKLYTCADPTLGMILLLVVCPPLAIFYKLGIEGLVSAIICGVLCVKLYYFPGLLFAILHVLC